MRFKYGSCFGMSAIHALFLTSSEIDALFSSNALKSSTLSLIENLYMECCALREIFSQEPSNNKFPHITLQKDMESTEMRNLISGFNCFIEQKHEVEKAEKSGLLDSFDVGALDIFSNSDNVVKSDDMPLTTHFFEGAASLTSESDSLDDLDALADIGSDDTLQGMDDLAELLPMDTSATCSYTYKDLISWGANATSSTQTVGGYLALMRYIKLHKSDFTPEELESITEQIRNLPAKPTHVTLPDTLPNRISTLSEDSIWFLSVIYSRMQKPINGEPFIDYLIAKLGKIRFFTNEQSQAIFFTSANDFTTDKTIWFFNNFFENLKENYLSQDKKYVLESNVRSLLADCRLVLPEGESTEDASIEIRQIRALLSEFEQAEMDRDLYRQTIIDKVLDYAKYAAKAEAPDEELELRELISFMIDERLLDTMLDTPNNLIFIITLARVLYDIVRNRMYPALKLAKYMNGAEPTLQNMQKYCTEYFKEFTQQTGICGLYVGYSPILYSTLRNIRDPLAANRIRKFERGTVNYEMISMLRAHLLSLQKRLHLEAEMGG